MKWNDITLRKFNLLQEAITIEDETERMIAIAEAIFGKEVLELPVPEFQKKMSEAKFITNPITNSIPPKSVKVNGRSYFVDGLIGRITTAQYIDFQNHAKTNKLENMLSTFIIPEGHKYNDGYEMEQVMEDILDLPITIVNSLAFFFKRQLEESLRIFQRFLNKSLKKQKMPKETIEKLDKMLTDCNNLASSLMF